MSEEDQKRVAKVQAMNDQLWMFFEKHLAAIERIGAATPETDDDQKITKSVLLGVAGEVRLRRAMREQDPK